MIERLACKLGRNDEIPNIELAEYLCQNNDAAGVMEIVEGFKGEDKAVANDCIKVLYEIGARKPELISDYASDFISRLYSKNNRLVWGSMTALSKIAEYNPKPVFEKLDAVVSALKNGSTITVDNSISVFAGICKANRDYAKEVLPIIMEHLQKCRPKEVAQHAERASICFDSENSHDFFEILKKRNQSLSEQQQVRVNRILKKLNDLRQHL